MVIYLAGWLIMTAIAYPRHKRWCKEELEPTGEWNWGDTFWAVIICLMAWWFVLIWFAFERVGNWNFWDKKSKI